MKRPNGSISSKGKCNYAVHHARKKKMNFAGVGTQGKHSWDKKTVAKCKNINHVEM